MLTKITSMSSSLGNLLKFACHSNIVHMRKEHNTKNMVKVDGIITVNYHEIKIDLMQF